MLKKYLTSAEVEEMIGVKQQTLAHWRSQGKGPQYIKIGKVIRYALDELEKWIGAHRVLTMA